MRRKGIPCGPDCCSPSKHCVKAINNVSPDPNGDLELKAGNGIGISQSGDNSITIINQAMASSFVAGDNIEINPVGDDLEIRVTDDVTINNLNVAGDIIQQGAAYETHAEKVYTTNDYIYMRDGAVGGLAVGDFSGFQVKKYDGTNDGRLVIDNSGVARVGDVGDEQPLLTREESANLNNGALLKWDGVNQKAVDEGTIGSDTKPVKIVNGVATEVTNAFALASDVSRDTQTIVPTSMPYYRDGIIKRTIIGGHIYIYTFVDLRVTQASSATVIDVLPSNAVNTPRCILSTLGSNIQGIAYVAEDAPRNVVLNITGTTYATGQMIVII